MRKVLILIVAVILATGIFFTLAYLRVPLGEPKLRIEFYPIPPWQVRAGSSLEVSIGVAMMVGYWLGLRMFVSKYHCLKASPILAPAQTSVS